MRKIIATVAAAAALSALGVTRAGASDAASRAGRPAGHPAVTASTAAAVPGAQLWAKRYNSTTNSDDAVSAMAISAGGDKVFVTGTSAGANSDNDYVTVAYNTATGAQLWAQRYNGPDNYGDRAASVAVSPRREHGIRHRDQRCR